MKNAKKFLEVITMNKIVAELLHVYVPKKLIINYHNEKLECILLEIENEILKVAVKTQHMFKIMELDIEGINNINIAKPKEVKN